MYYLYRYSGVEQLNHRWFSHLQECYLMTVRHFASTTWTSLYKPQLYNFGMYTYKHRGPCVYVY
jgi:hypothetical protein